MVLIMVFVLMLNASCSLGKKEYVVWNDADGTLIEHATVKSDFDPSTKELPKDSDQWHYTGWNIAKTEEKTVCTALRVKKTKVKWLDADDSVLKEELVPITEVEKISFDLPSDSNEWDYVEWVKSSNDDGIVFNAKRLPKTKYTWKDADGTILKEVYLVDGQEKPEVDLPVSNDKWKYLEWKTTEDEKEYIYEATRLPVVDWFVGNVFQIVLKDLNGTPIGTGSGFVLNDEGWFITNNHVMKDANSAVAFFDIEDKSSGNKYTQLNVLGGIYNSADKDFFIGKLEGYAKIKQYYNKIGFTEEYTVGEKVYTLGYPNSSVKMEINGGEILEEYSDIYSKINGVCYVLSDSYIAPGSSGGILINNNFEVVGITTIGLYEDTNKRVYKCGGSIPTTIFSQYLKNFNVSEIKILTDIYK